MGRVVGAQGRGSHKAGQALRQALQAAAWQQQGCVLRMHCPRPAHPNFYINTHGLWVRKRYTILADELTRTVTSLDRLLPRTGIVTVAMWPSWLMATLELYQGPAVRGPPTVSSNRGLLAAASRTMLAWRVAGGRSSGGEGGWCAQRSMRNGIKRLMNTGNSTAVLYNRYELRYSCACLHTAPRSTAPRSSAPLDPQVHGAVGGSICCGVGQGA